MSNAISQNIPAPSGFVQDGRDFYDAITNCLVASYPNLVANDYDIVGAVAARSAFLADHPNYSSEGE